MATPRYQAFAFLPEGTDFTLDRFEAQLRDQFRRFPALKLDREDVDELRIRAADGSIRLWLRQEMSTENARLAAGLPSERLAESIAQCPRRLEVWVTGTDPHNRLRQLFESVCAAVNAIPEAIVVDILKHHVFAKGEPLDPVDDPAVVEQSTGPSAEELYRQARGLWAEAIDLGIHDDPAALRRVAGILQRAFRSDPTHVPTLTLLADLLAALTAYAEADEFARKACEAEPGVAEHAQWREMLALPNGPEKLARIMSHLAAKWHGSAW